MAKNLFNIGAARRRKNRRAEAGEAWPSSSAPRSNGVYADYGEAGEETPAPGGDDGNVQPGGNGTSGGGNGGGGAHGSFDDYYNRLIETLRGYGINMTLPTLDELYSQLASFLRPSVDAAIENRRNYSDTVMAELDADAYSRGMGGSSYLSSMKDREYGRAASDIAAMESNYNATLAEYLYNASNELSSIQLQFEQLRRQHEYEMQRLRAQQRHDLEMQRLRAQQSAHSGGASGSTGSGEGESQEGGGEPLSDEQYEANFNAYSVYMRAISADERYNVFNSSSPYWRAIRDEMFASLTPQAYNELRALFDPNYGEGHGRNPHGAFGSHPTVNIGTVD